jgi:Nif-specific regulatory protein/two-component system response regulator AtoC
MNNRLLSRLTPVSFLQAFVIHSINLWKKHNAQYANRDNSVQYLGLSASSCFEETVRKQLEFNDALTHDQYADVIIEIKNQIGGEFTRASSDEGVIRVENTRCPFGALVKETPELCQMTSSVFGGIAARNFGYAQVELRKRIAIGDPVCDAAIYLNRESHQNRHGDEYFFQDGALISKLNDTDAIVEIADNADRYWCGCGSTEAAIVQKKQSPVIGLSKAIRDVMDAIEIVAPTMANVLLGGETGVGKELIARAIHATSGRNPEKFIAVNCAAIAESLIESALFGHEKGAFTGAYNVHKGFFERACSGTLFLDEIDGLSLTSQAKFLRVLQEGEFERVGGRQLIKTDVRIIVASNRKLKDLASAGEFRKDLFYRLNIVTIDIPPLRERRDDIVALVDHFLKKLSLKYQKPPKNLGEQAWLKMMRYDWPGNIRELENVLESAFLFAKTEVIENIAVEVADSEVGQTHRNLIQATKKKITCDVEKKLLHDALARCSGNVSAVAREMRVTPRAIHQKLKKHRIDADEYRTK